MCEWCSKSCVQVMVDAVAVKDVSGITVSWIAASAAGQDQCMRVRRRATVHLESVREKSAQKACSI